MFNYVGVKVLLIVILGCPLLLCSSSVGRAWIFSHLMLYCAVLWPVQWNSLIFFLTYSTQESPVSKSISNGLNYLHFYFLKNKNMVLFYLPGKADIFWTKMLNASLTGHRLAHTLNQLRNSMGGKQRIGGAIP